MLFAVDFKGKRIRATPGSQALCPCCQTVVLAKCGEINVWHWSHRDCDECDIWHEPETKWHLDWKTDISPNFCEVIKGPHRADIIGNNGVVIELQHSPISPEEIREREAFYGNMIWLFDASSYARNFSFRDRGDYFSFRWKWPRKSLFACKKPVFFDLSGVPYSDKKRPIFHAKKIHSNTPCGGYGTYIETGEFVLDWVKGR